MSIIHDALKKATEDAHDNARQGEAAPAQAGLMQEEAPAKKMNNQRPQKTTLPVKLIWGLLITIGIILLNNYFLQASRSKSAQSHDDKFAAPIEMPSIKKAPITAEVQPILGNNKPDELLLTGIVYEDAEPMAVINNSIYTEGEFVNGAKIVKISEEKVVLRKGIEEIELKVK